MRNPVKHFYEFGPFRLDADRHRLLRDGAIVPLPPKALEALTVLIKQPGVLLEREELMQAVWADTFVEDANLTVAISHLRKALGQNGDSVEYIETIPRVGYRFVADVREIRQDATPLIVEKHTLSQTVIEEEVVDDSTASTISTVTIRSPWISPLPALAAGAREVLWAVCILFALALASVFYFTRGEHRQPAAASVVGREINSLAVLPLRSLTTGSDNTSLTLGMTDAMINRLGSLRRVVVRPTSAVVRYVDTKENPLDVGRALKVDAVLEGTIQRADARMRVTLRLVDVANGNQIWTGIFDEKDGDLFKLQDSMSQQVAQALPLELSEADHILLAKRQTQNAEAYAQYVKGNYFWNKRGLEVEKSVEYFRKAIDLDPNFAQAYVGLANVYAVTSSRSPEAELLIEKALQLDDTLAEAHATHGFIRMFHHWDWVGARTALDRAIALNPNSAVAHHWKGVYLSLRGRLDEAKAEMHWALNLDPLSLIIAADIGQLHYFAREYAEAEAQCRTVLEMDPNFMMAHLYLHFIYLRQGKLGEARQASQDVRRLTGPDWSENSINDAIRDAVAGHSDRAIASLEKAWAGHMFLLPYINVDPLYDGLRTDPRFADLIRRTGLGV
jgi:DNA-binding winged helix-turn-helix (wHTH) protein/TolB-like protein/Tfp pilus assembly protein PilF